MMEVPTLVFVFLDKSHFIECIQQTFTLFSFSLGDFELCHQRFLHFISGSYWMTQVSSLITVFFLIFKFF